MTFTEQLHSLNACGKAIRWVNGRPLRKCWQVADRVDWMIWLAVSAGIDRKALVLAACDCAETSLKYVPACEGRPRKAIETARAWCHGDASITEVRDAADAAADAAAEAAAAAAYAATYAAAAAAAAAEAASYAADAAADAYAEAAAEAASAATYAAAAAAAYADARHRANKKMCRLIRKRIPVELIEEALQEGES